eukprot:GHVS01052408.1.p1 GENE.GHVS01052408.1~~GHVS01052408.1.p1  ORF type:complete len:458 (+),score=60.93 GHVS01052408.1:463-1836(+)
MRSIQTLRFLKCTLWLFYLSFSLVCLQSLAHISLLSSALTVYLLIPSSPPPDPHLPSASDGGGGTATIATWMSVIVCLNIGRLVCQVLVLKQVRYLISNWQRLQFIRRSVASMLRSRLMLIERCLGLIVFLWHIPGIHMANHCSAQPPFLCSYATAVVLLFLVFTGLNVTACLGSLALLIYCHCVNDLDSLSDVLQEPDRTLSPLSPELLHSLRTLQWTPATHSGQQVTYAGNCDVLEEQSKHASNDESVQHTLTMRDSNCENNNNSVVAGQHTSDHNLLTVTHEHHHHHFSAEHPSLPFVGCQLSPSRSESADLTPSTIAGSSPRHEWDDVVVPEEGPPPLRIDIPVVISHELSDMSVPPPPSISPLQPPDDFCLSKRRSSLPLAASCSICLCEYEEEEILRILPCGHGFHVECVDVWLATRAVCPLRCDIIKLLCMREEERSARHDRKWQGSEAC